MASIKNIKIGTATYTIKADYDGEGNKIVDTYATKNEVTTNITNKLGVVNGIATLDASGKVPSSLLPSFVDDVIESDTKSTFPETGEDSKIYVDKQTNKTYRWSGSGYVEISSSLALGETVGTAYEGSKGKATTDTINTHVENTENPHQVTKAQVGLSDVDNTSDKNKPISDATLTALDKKVNIVEGKGLSTNDYTTAEKNKLAAISATVTGEILSIVTQ